MVSVCAAQMRSPIACLAEETALTKIIETQA
jgi:hypothetical protein